MSDERRSEGGGAIVVIVVVLILIGLVGIVGVGGGMWFIQRMTLQRMQVEVEERQAMAQMMEAEMQAKAAALKSIEALEQSRVNDLQTPSTMSHEVLLKIDAAGNFKFAGRPIKFEDLPAMFAKAKVELPEGLRLRIQAELETPFELVEKAMKAGTDAGLNKQTIERPPQS